MVDLHHHLLPGLDDGPADLVTSVAMARAAAADGITHIVATPHASGRYAFDTAVVADRLATLREALAAESIGLTLASGCDFHLSYENIQDAIANPRKYTINTTEYLLVELPDHGISTNIDEIFYELRLAGMVPILTHPERNPTLQRDHSRLGAWMRNGMLTQVTTSSILGQMGKPAEQMVRTLLANRWVHFAATDAHNLTTRPPLMQAACEALTQRYGADYATRLCVTNPRAVFEGRPLPEQEEPQHLYDEDEFVGAPWWKRLFKR
jgi:protein-tyrosine phosphatase